MAALAASDPRANRGLFSRQQGPALRTAHFQHGTSSSADTISCGTDPAGRKWRLHAPARVLHRSEFYNTGPENAAQISRTGPDLTRRRAPAIRPQHERVRE